MIVLCLTEMIYKSVVSFLATKYALGASILHLIIGHSMYITMSIHMSDTNSLVQSFFNVVGKILYSGRKMNFYKIEISPQNDLRTALDNLNLKYICNNIAHIHLRIAP